MKSYFSKSSAFIAACFLTAFLTAARAAENETASWTRHVIDDSSIGADGVRMADVNGDGVMDIAAGWEEGGVIRLYLQPEKAKVKQPWPAVTVGDVASPEDAVFADLDGDGAMDVVSCCEGTVKDAIFSCISRDGIV